MAVRTRTTNRKSGQTPATVTFKSKSDHARHLFNQGMTVKDVAKTLNMNYAFAYGVAKRAGLAEQAAGRRKPAGAKFVAFLKFIDPTITDAQAAAIIVAYAAAEVNPLAVKFPALKVKATRRARKATVETTAE